MNQELCELLNEKYKQIRELQITIGELERQDKNLLSYVNYLETLMLNQEKEFLEQRNEKLKSNFKVISKPFEIKEWYYHLKPIKPQKLMHYEDRNILSYEIVDSILRTIHYEIRDEASREVLYDKVEQLLEPYTTGDYSSYN